MLRLYLYVSALLAMAGGCVVIELVERWLRRKK